MHRMQAALASLIEQHLDPEHFFTDDLGINEAFQVPCLKSHFRCQLKKQCQIGSDSSQSMMHCSFRQPSADKGWLAQKRFSAVCLLPLDRSESSKYKQGGPSC